MKLRTVIYADDGMVLTNGYVYGKQIFLADDEVPSDYHEISEQEYIAYCEQCEAKAREYLQR